MVQLLPVQYSAYLPKQIGHPRFKNLRAVGVEHLFAQPADRPLRTVMTVRHAQDERTLFLAAAPCLRDNLNIRQAFRRPDNFVPQRLAARLRAPRLVDLVAKIPKLLQVCSFGG